MKKEEKTWQNDGNDRCSNRCSRVLGACTTCYRGARIRFKTIRCGWACLPLPLSAVLQPGTRERGREFSVASAKPHHHVPRLRAFQEFKNSRSRGVSLMMNARPTGNPFSSSFVRETFTAIFFPPRFFVVNVRYRLSESCITLDEDQERLIILIAFLVPFLCPRIILDRDMATLSSAIELFGGLSAPISVSPRFKCG